jgi:hypothetical protein
MRKRLRRTGPGVLAALGVVALLLGTATATPAISTGSAVRYVAPYSGTVTISTQPNPSGCNASAKFPVKPSFNLTTGLASVSEKAAASACPPLADSSSTEGASVGFTSSPFTSKGGFQHLKLALTLDFSAKLVASPGSSTQTVWARFYVIASFTVYDQTTSTTLATNSSQQIEVTIYSGTYAHTYSHAHLFSYVNATLVTSDSYYFVAQIEDITTVYMTPGTSTASASLNMGSGGRSGDIASVSV